MSMSSLEQLELYGVDSYALRAITPAKKQAALDSACVKIQNRLGTQFPLPWQGPYPLDLVECECVLASVALLSKNGYNPTPGQDKNLDDTRAYWEAWLQQASIGEVPMLTLIYNKVPAAEAPASGPSVISESQRGYSTRGTGHRPGPFSGD
jgi:phage gp36-like protein